MKTAVIVDFTARRRLAIVNSTARRRVAIDAAARFREEARVESELDCRIDDLEQDFEDWLVRERRKREEYERIMAEKNR